MESIKIVMEAMRPKTTGITTTEMGITTTEMGITIQVAFFVATLVIMPLMGFVMMVVPVPALMSAILAVIAMIVEIEIPVKTPVRPGIPPLMPLMEPVKMAAPMIPIILEPVIGEPTAVIAGLIKESYQETTR